MQNKPDVSVVIVNYNTIGLTRECLKSVFASRLGTYSMEVIVCDNGSNDGSLEMIRKEFPKVILIDNKKNLGFAAGNNRGITKAKGRYILLLNTDTEVTKNTLRFMLTFMDENTDIGVSTPRLLLPDGSMDPACHRGFPTLWVAMTYVSGMERLLPHSKLFGEYHQGFKDLTKVHEVDCISGAFFLLRRNVIDDVGLLDEDYFMYAEDIDWCYRIRKANWKIMYNPSVTVIHKKKQSGRAHEDRKRQIQSEIYFHRYNWLFYKKHFAKKYGTLLTLVVNTFYSMRLFLLEKLSL